MDYFQTLERWFQVSNALKELKAEEIALRVGLFGGTFPKPREGVNKVTLPDGRVLKGTYVINRTLDQKWWLDNYKQVGIPKEIKTKLIAVTYGFHLEVYRELPEQLRKNFDKALIIKPGAPKLELVPPKDD